MSYANSIDPVQTLRSASALGLHFLSLSFMRLWVRINDMIHCEN